MMYVKEFMKAEINSALYIPKESLVIAITIYVITKGIYHGIMLIEVE